MKLYFNNREKNRKDSLFYRSFKNQLLQIFGGEMCLLSIAVFFLHINKKYSADCLALQLTIKHAPALRDVLFAPKGRGRWAIPPPLTFGIQSSILWITGFVSQAIP